MRRLLISLVAVVMLVGLFPTVADAQTSEGSGTDRDEKPVDTNVESGDVEIDFPSLRPDGVLAVKDPVPVLVEDGFGSAGEVIERRLEPPASWRVTREVRGASRADEVLDSGVEVRVPADTGRRTVSVGAASAPDDVAKRLSDVGVVFSLDVVQVGGQLHKVDDNRLAEGEAGREVGEDQVPDTFFTTAAPSADQKLEEIRDEGGKLVGYVPSRRVIEERRENTERPETVRAVDPQGLRDSGWSFRVELDEGNIPAGMPLDQFVFVHWSGCDSDAVCSVVRELPTSVDWDTGELVVEIPNRVMALTGKAFPSESARDRLVAQAAGDAAWYGLSISSASSFSDYSAIPQSLSTYQVGVQTGHAEAGYSFTTPPAVGPNVDVSLSYSSGVVDAATSTSNNHGGLVGLGWSLSGSQITRELRTCSVDDDLGNYNGNMCFAAADISDGFSITLNGTSSRLSKIDGASGTVGGLPGGLPYQDYRLEYDPGWRVRRITETGPQMDSVSLAVQSSTGYWMVNPAGEVHAYGTATHYGNAPALASGDFIVDIVAYPLALGDGYWIISDRGRVYEFEDAPNIADLMDFGVNPAVGVRAAGATPSGNGMFLIAGDGGLFGLGDAVHPGTANYSNPFGAIDIAVISSTQAWVMTQTGQVTAFGGAPVLYDDDWNDDETAAMNAVPPKIFDGPHQNDIVAIVPNAANTGYLLVRHDGAAANKNFGPGSVTEYDAYGQAFQDVVAVGVDVQSSPFTENGLWYLQKGGIVRNVKGASWTLASDPQAVRDRWEVTTPDGTVYHFGYGREPDLLRATGSIATVPVYDPGRGCSRSLCDTALSWGLDRVVDTSGNSSQTFYLSETNAYQAHYTTSLTESRGYVKSIIPTVHEYGDEPGDGSTSSTSNDATAMVLVGYSPRTGNTTALSLACTYADLACSRTQPSFWSSNRLSLVRTNVRSGVVWDPINEWIITSTEYTATNNTGFVPGGDNGTVLALQTVKQQNAAVGSTEANYPVIYKYVDKPNRADDNPAAGDSALWTPRLDQITNEIGGIVDFVYGQDRTFNSTGCIPSTAQFAYPEQLPCDFFPSITGPNTADPNNPEWGFFNKWKVVSQTVRPRWVSPPSVTTFDYDSDPVWTFSEGFGRDFNDTLCQAGYGCNSYSDYRGHQQVTVHNPDGGRTEYTFYTGANGDRAALTNTAPSSVTFTDYPSGTETDHKELAGRVRSVRQFGKIATHELSATVTTYSIAVSSPTYLGGSPLWPDTRQILALDTHNYLWDNAGASQVERQVTVTYDDYGNPKTRTDAGASNNTTDELFTEIEYVYNVTDWMVAFPTRVSMYAGTSNTALEISSEKFLYDVSLDSANWAATAPAPSRGLLTQTRTSVRTSSGVIDRPVTQSRYNGRGQVVERRDPFNNALMASYDGVHGYQTSVDGVASGSGDATSFEIDPKFGTVVEVLAPDSQKTEATYDWIGRLESVTEPGFTSPSIEFSYYFYGGSVPNHVVTLTHRDDAQPDIYVLTFVDGLGRDVQSQSHSGTNTSDRYVTSTEFDAAGRPKFVSAPFDEAAVVNPGSALLLIPDWSVVPSYQEFVYDDGAQSRTTTTQMGGGTQQWSTSVHSDGLLRTSIDALGRSTIQQTHIGGRVEAVTNASSITTTYGYDSAGRLSTVTANVGSVSLAPSTTTIAHFEPGGLRSSIIDPDTGTTSFTYDKSARIVTQTDSRPETLWFGYDALGRRTELRQNTASGALLASWSFDPVNHFGKLATSSSYPDQNNGINPTPLVTVTNGYDTASNRLTSRTWDIDDLTESQRFEWTYRDSGAVETVTYPDNEVLTTSFNHLEQPISMTSSVHGALVRSAGYEPFGAMASLNTGNGITAIDTTYGYDTATLRLESLISTKSGSNVLDYDYVWDDAGNLTRKADLGEGVSTTQYQCYSYDVLNQLTKAFTTTIASGSSGCGAENQSGPDPFSNTWKYFDNGNIDEATGPGTVGGTYGYGTSQPHAVETAGANTYSYDSAGNMVTRNVSGQTGQTLGYDLRQRLVSITEAGQTAAEFVYDADGVRVVRSVGDVTTYVINELYQIEVDLSPSGQSLAVEPFEAASNTAEETPVAADEVSDDGPAADPSETYDDEQADEARPDGLVPAGSAFTGDTLGQVFQAASTLSLLLVSASSGPHTNDVSVKTHLEAAGHTVTVIDDDVLTSGSATGFDVVLVSDTVSTSKVTNLMEAVAVPVVHWKSWVYDDNELTPNCGSGNCGQTSTNLTTISIDDPGHPLAAGLSGTVTVTTSATKQSFGKPTVDADIVATNPNDSSQAVIFGYDTGDMMDGGFVAPERRVGFFFRKVSPDIASTDGWTLFDAAIDWAANVGTGGGGNTAPTVDAGIDATILTTDTASLDGTVTDDGLPSGTVTQTWSKVSGPGTVTFGNSTAVDTTATFSTDGSYVLKLEATDTALIASDTVTITINPPGGGGPLSLLLVSASSGPHVNDVSVKSHLEAAGHTVTVIDDDVLTSGSATGFDVVLVSDSVSTSKVANLMEAVAVPVVFWKSWIYDDNELSPSCGSGNCGQTSTNLTTISITDPGHPLAAGLSGTVTVTTSATKQSFGKPTVDADIVATNPNDSSQAVIFGYDTGDMMDGGFVAPERRVGFFFRKVSPDIASTDGWILFDAAIDWAADNGSTGGSGNLAPSVDAGNTATITLPSTATLDGTVTDDGLPSGTVTQTWSWVSGPGTVTFGNPTAVDTTATFSTDGTYVLKLEATDTALTASDTVTITVNPDPGAGTGRITTGLQILYEFNDGSGTTVTDTSGVGTPLNLTIGTPASTSWASGALDVTGDTLINSGSAATKVNTAVTASNEITIEAWVDPANITQNGPARIVTISDTPSTRNATIGQGVFNSTGDRIEARLRTTGTGTNGTPATQTAAGTLDSTLQHVVYTRDSAGNVVIYMDGAVATTGTASGDMSTWDTSFQLALAAELDGSRYWHGTYHLVAIYDQALTNAEVIQNFNEGPNPGLVPPTTTKTSYYMFGGQAIGYSTDGTLTTTAAGHLGSTEITNTGGTINRQSYLPYGAIRGTSSNSLATDHTYTAQIDDGRGLLHYRARQYDPVLGRFTQADDITPGLDNRQLLDRYGYVGGNPLNLTDPSGHCPVELQNSPLCFEHDFEERGGYLEAGVAASSASTNIPVVAGAGVVKLNLFIEQSKVCWLGFCVDGDDRVFDSTAGLADSRATLILDFENGRATGGFNFSCGSVAIFGVCKDAFPVTITSSSDAIGDDQLTYLVENTLVHGRSKNGFAIFETRNGFSIQLWGKVSVGPPGSPSIDAALNLTFDESGIAAVDKFGNGFPSYEVYQDVGGGFTTRLEFEQGTHGDLVDGPKGALYRFFLTCDGPLC